MFACLAGPLRFIRCLELGLNHERWCALHGYSYACLEENIAGRSDPTWSKIPHVLIFGRVSQAG